MRFKSTAPRPLTLLRSASLALLAGLALGLPVHAAAFAPPPEAISIEDPRMAEYYRDPANRPVLSGRIKDTPEALRGKLSLSLVIPVVNDKSQTSVILPIAPDGTFRYAFADAFPLREMFLRLETGTPSGSLQSALYLARGLDIEITFVEGKPRPRVRTSGPDKELDDIAQGFRKFEPSKQAKLFQNLAPWGRRKAGERDAALAELAETKKVFDALLAAYAPAKHGWILQQEIDARYFAQVLSVGFHTGQSLEDQPVWAEVMAFRPYILSTPSLAYYRNLQIYLESGKPRVVSRTGSELLAKLTSREAKATPTQKALIQEYREAHAEAKAKRQPLSPRLREIMTAVASSGLLDRDTSEEFQERVRTCAQRIPDEKSDFVLLVSVRPEPDRAVDAFNAIIPHVGSRWPRLLIADALPTLKAELATINATLAQAQVVPGGELGAAAIVLPSGARLYQLPDLSGRELLARVKQSAGNKALILDFWGPWCPPCMADLPYSETMHAALKDAPVEFVYFGCRTTEPQWKEAIARLRLSGIHVLLTAQQNEELMALFGSSGYPTYVFLDRKGELRPGAISRFALMKPEQLRQLLD